METMVKSKKDCSCYQENGYCTVSGDKCNPFSVKCRKNNKVCNYSIEGFVPSTTNQPQKMYRETDGKIFYRTTLCLISMKGTVKTRNY